MMPGLLQCSHADCRHRLDGRICGLLASGATIVLNAVGQCEMREPRTGPAADYGIGEPCLHDDCFNPGVGLCAVCGLVICAEHRCFVPNGARNDQNQPMVAALCDRCILGHIDLLTQGDNQS